MGAWTLDDIQEIIDRLQADLDEAFRIRDVLKEGKKINDEGEDITSLNTY